MADDAGVLISGRVTEPTRRLFTFDDIMRWQAAGVIDPDERFELLDGEIIDMPSEGGWHKRYKTELGRFFTRQLPDDLRCVVDSTLVLSPIDAPEPDIHICRSRVEGARVSGPDVLLLIEVADSSVRHDRERKATKYAAFGVQEYWVVDLTAEVTWVFGAAAGGSYGEPKPFRFDETLTPVRLPDMAVKLSELPDLDRQL